MKPQPSATRLRPSKLCRLLLLAFSLKLAVLGLMVLDPSLSSLGERFSRLSVPAFSAGGGIAQ
ncbi:MAG: hypothetical protein LBJ82_04400, partial [Deltaproteobacteria bacterium]|nr:hypothetical protein [Deltaproteobacteria bacterium]